MQDNNKKTKPNSQGFVSINKTFDNREYYNKLLKHIKLQKYKDKDSALFAQYVQTIKGYMSAAEFAELLEVNPSTVSRLLSESYKSTVTEALVKKLADMLTPEMDISLEMFFDANGMRIDDRRALMSARMQYRRNLEELAVNIILKEISNRNKTYSRYAGNTRLNLKGGVVLLPDLLIDVEGVVDEELNKNTSWAIDFILGPKSEKTYGEPYRRTAMSVFQRISMMALQAMQYDAEIYEDDYDFHEVPGRYSVVFDNEDEFNAVVNMIDEIKCPMATTLILIDIKTKSVVKEIPLRDMSGYRHDAFFGVSYYTDDDENLISKEEYYELLEDELEKMELRMAEEDD